MTKIKFPEPLEALLKESSLLAPIRTYADCVGEILADNKLPFFPDYTDHGIEHVNRVLKSEIALVPKEVWDKSKKDSDPRLLCDIDAVVIIGATLLHDFAMHLRQPGFLELIKENSRFKPLPWFKDHQEGYSADRPWYDLWLDFLQEARRFNDNKLGQIIGLESAQQGWRFEKLPEDTGRWERNHCLIIGEFIRRHHARLAHEIAIYGFPGLEIGSNEEQFPALAAMHPLQKFADIIGLTARSHGLSLRVCQTYLNASPDHTGTLKPMGSAVIYPMALLRVADYFQIEGQRAPAILLKLRNPQSPISVQEWKKHSAIQSIGPTSNPRGKMITVSTDISHTVYLQLRDLLTDLQSEIDHATAVLDETYGAHISLGLDQLNLATRRVDSNLHKPVFRDNLPYVPEHTGFTADPNLLTLLVEPLYGKEPGVGVRELMQNAVDAVRELYAWCENHHRDAEILELPAQDSDVQIDFIQRENETWFLRVTDKGIGMTAETIQNYFLRAGASFRQSADWAKEFLDEKGLPCVLRTGRFGIGVFAIFLLGPKFRLRTRHISANKNKGYYIEALADNQVIEIRKCEENLPIGTVIEVDLNKKSIMKFGLDKATYREKEGLRGQTDWFGLNWPNISRRIIKRGEPEDLHQKYVAHLQNETIPPEWSVIYPPNFDKVYWTFADYPNLMCNGIIIDRVHPFSIQEAFNWPNREQLMAPNIAVFDSNGNLSLTIQRYALSDKNLPFINELSRDVTLSFIAHALICGPMDRNTAHEYKNTSHPLALMDGFDKSLLRWCTSYCAMVPADSWLYSLLETENCFVFGSIDFYDYTPQKNLQSNNLKNISVILQSLKCHTILSCNRQFEIHGEDELTDALSQIGKLISLSVESILQHLDKNTIDTQIFISFHTEQILSEEIKNAFENFDSNKYVLQSIASSCDKRLNFLLGSERIEKFLQLDHFTKVIESCDKEQKNSHDIYYVAEIKTKPGSTKPESLLAKLWNECLGPKPIPFDSKARDELIEQGRKHPELNRHIKAWEEMRRTGSKWAI